MALFSSVTLICCSLPASTYYLQSMGGTNGSPPWPIDPYKGAYPLEQIGPDRYVIEDGSGSTSQYGMMAESADGIDPGDTNNVDTNTYSGNSLPANIRNYAKYGAQFFAMLDTNSVLNDDNDTNLYTACAAIPASTNAAWLTVVRYGADGVLIRADNFDYSQTNADFVLLVCDKLQTPTWKAIDFDGASDAQDGWLVQGRVANGNVTGTMFFQVTNLNTTYNAFFKAIPYSGPQVAIIGTNQPGDTVSNTITLTTQILDLSGTANEQFDFDVDGAPARCSFSSNAITLDTRYNQNNYCNVNLNAASFASVYGIPDTNTPQDVMTEFEQGTSFPLNFDNDTYMVFQSDNAEPDIGTNFIEFAISKAQNVAAIITDPSNNNVVYAATNYIDSPGTVAVPWNFTEGDGVTPYSNDTYAVTFIAFDPTTLTVTNSISRDGVRTGTGVFLTYEMEDPS